MQNRNTFWGVKEQITRSIFVSIMIYVITRASISNAYPIFAQQGYENPREATGRIVCANCHLASKTRPAPGQKYSEIVFPILSPDPATKKDIHFFKYPIYVGGNRGRGQIYPDGSKSNNTVYNATSAGIVSKIVRKEKGGGYEITIIDASDGHQVVDIIPRGPELLVSEGESIKLDQPLTSNPNVGGFGQGDAEIVLQDPLRIQGLLFFLASVILAQIFLVLKKKQFEKVQLYEMNF
ncbi:Cytochrome f [Dioscorea sansibarensis]